MTEMAAKKQQKPLTPGLVAVDEAVAKYRKHFDVLADRVTQLDDLVRLLTTRRLPGILTAAAAVTSAEAELKAVIEAHAPDFVSPKSQVMHGIRVGFRKGSGSITWDDADQVVALIEKHFPDQVDLLIATQKAPIKDALNRLSAAELKKLGCTVEDTGDVVFVKPLESNVAKLVKALLKNAEKEARESE